MSIYHPKKSNPFNNCNQIKLVIRVFVLLNGFESDMENFIYEPQMINY